MMSVRILAAISLLILAACAGTGARLQTPELSFVRMRTVEASLFEQKLELRLRVRNPNSLGLPVRGLEVDVELAGEHFAHGVSAREFTVPAQGEAEFDMLVTANAANALFRLATGDRQSREQVSYTLRGKLTTRLGISRTIPFEESGTLPLREFLGRHR